VKKDGELGMKMKEFYPFEMYDIKVIND